MESRALLRESNPCVFPLSVLRARRFSRNLVSTHGMQNRQAFLYLVSPPITSILYIIKRNQKSIDELRSSTPVLVLRRVPVKEVVDVMDAENDVPLSAAKPLEEDSVSECIELAELEK